MTWRLMLQYEEEGPDGPEFYEHLAPGYQQNVRMCIRRDRRNRRKLGCAAYSRSTHRKARKVGPVPLPFKHRRRRW